jgi:hypothetical protein
VIALLNVPKDGKNYRGSGLIADRFDVLYEVRDITDLAPSPKGAAWWSTLAEAGEAAWQDRAARRKRRDDYRLAFVPSKFRIGQEPDPMAVELSLVPGNWEIRDVSAELVEAHAEGQRGAKLEEFLSRDQARASVADLLLERGQQPLRKGEAEEHLHRLGLTRDAARVLVESEHDREGALWCLDRLTDLRGRPIVLRPFVNLNQSAEIDKSKSACAATTSGGGISAALAGQAPQKCMSAEPLCHKGQGDSVFPRRIRDDTQPDSTAETPAEVEV